MHDEPFPRDAADAAKSRAERHVVVDEPAALAALFAARCERELGNAIAARGTASLVVTGGSAAEVLLPRLVNARIHWPRTDVFWSDERAVPPDDAQSNYRLARELWLDPARVPAASVHRMPGEAEDLAAAAAAHARELVAVCGEPPRFDVMLLGVGPDGHVASLFPGHPLLGERQKLVAAVEDSPKPPPRRLTLTLPALFAARLLVVAAFGAAKAAVIAEALGDPASRLPVARVLAAAERSLVLLDAAAAGR
ncbi:MAG TPA: 6-phosphogluconolactonase [Thermoanaerobaculia bacterium]|jgi:6-phosphogluconolactonase|nr:6-phosphogluconolactonase [Thermoanaerobaculia bacterium]